MIRELAERLWQGSESTLERHPFTPLGVYEEIAERSAFFSSFANVTALDTDDGLVLIDAGGHLVAPLLRGQLRAWSERPVAAAVYTHGHVDHVAGMALFDEEAAERGRPRPVVYAHEAVPARFARYRETLGWNSCINARQFSLPVKWPDRYRAPDVLYRDRTTVEVGGLALELHHARGETDDATWVWVPSRKVLLTGDLFIWAAPNAGNPQKVQRYAGDWARALRQMAALGAEVLAPGHGVPIWGAARVRQALEETAELLEHLHGETLRRMNEGWPLHRILAEVKAPPALLERPYLRPVYDEPEFIVRNVWRLYGGWWDGDPASLKPPAPAALAAEVAGLAGGVARLVERAEALAEAGEGALACQLVEWAHRAAPDDAAVRAARRSIYRRRADGETSLMARGIFGAAADE